MLLVAILNVLFMLYSYYIVTIYTLYIVLNNNEIIKQIGILSLAGRIAGINLYLRKGTIVARKAGGGLLVVGCRLMVVFYDHCALALPSAF